MQLNQNLDTFSLFNRIVDWVENNREDNHKSQEAILVLPLWAYQRLDQESLENIGVSGLTYSSSHVGEVQSFGF